MAATQTIIHMNQGDGEKSYAQNSSHQMMVINETLPIIKDIIEDMLLNHSSSPFEMLESFRIADLGCGSGANTLLFVSEIIDTIHRLSKQNNNKKLEILVVLNDMHKNDFNNIFSKLPLFYEQLKEKYGHEFSRKCFVSSVPASFYGGLLPRKSLDFVHSSYCLHWLSQVPENLNNKEHIYMSKTRDPNVFNAYQNQFYKDFSSFLAHRSREILPAGRMVLTLVGRRNLDPSTSDGCYIIELLAQSLLDVVSQGLIKKEDLDSFNLPVYHPCKDEVKEIVEEEKSFEIEKLYGFENNWNPNYKNYDDNIDKFDKRKNGKIVTHSVRSIIEPILVPHFGELVMDNVFESYEERAIDDFEEMVKAKYLNLVICLRKK